MRAVSRLDGNPDRVGRVLLTMATYKDLLQQARSRTKAVETAEAEALINQPGTHVIDVREADEYEQGALPGAIHIPRGFLEQKIDNYVVDKGSPVVVYCASGNRSAFAADTLGQLGYTNVLNMSGGFGKWKNEDRDWKAPRSLTPEQ